MKNSNKKRNLYSVMIAVLISAVLSASLSYKVNADEVASGTESGISTLTDATATDAQLDEITDDVYNADGDRPSRPDRRTKVDAEAPVFVKQPELIHYVIYGTDYDAPTYTVSAKLPEVSTENDITFQWYVEGEAYGDPIAVSGKEEHSLSVTINELVGKPYGVYSVCCKAVTPNGHESESYTTNFIITKGVEANSLVTFSDLHEKWNNVGSSVEEVMNRNDGYIPSLIIATGDFNNNHYAGFIETNINIVIETMINRIALQLGGIDTVWVSGNHDNGYATGFTNANKKAGLGMVDEDYYDVAAGISGTGIIFDTRSDDYKKNAESSSNIDPDAGLVVIGVNYEDMGSKGAYLESTNGQPSDATKLRYGNAELSGTVYEYLDNALKKVSENYNGELVVISTHAGVHGVGIDPDSTASDRQRPGRETDDGSDSRVRPDSDDRRPSGPRGDAYNISESQEIVKLINSYVDEYEMDVIFLFGHNHSRGETEFLKLPGDKIVSIVDSVEKTTEENTLSFSYGHAGYITDRNDERYTYLT